jgi:uncharacterized protein (TIGR02300 family)
VSKPELGHKLTCTGCGVRFYDLSRSPAICPKCGAEQPAVAARAGTIIRGGGMHWSARARHISVAEPPAAAEAAVATEETDVDEAEEADEIDSDEDETIPVEEDE